MIKRWKKPRTLRINPITIKDVVARDNERALVECARMSNLERRQALKKLQALIQGVCG